MLATSQLSRAMRLGHNPNPSRQFPPSLRIQRWTSAETQQAIIYLCHVSHFTEFGSKEVFFAVPLVLRRTASSIQNFLCNCLVVCKFAFMIKSQSIVTTLSGHSDDMTMAFHLRYTLQPQNLGGKVFSLYKPFTVSDTHTLCGRFSSSVQLTKQTTLNPVTSGLLQLKIVHFFRFDLEIVTRRCSFAFITSGGFCVA